MTVTTTEVTYHRERWTELGGVWTLECDNCGGYNEDPDPTPQVNIFLRGYATEADATTAGRKHRCYPPAVAQHQQALAEIDDEDLEDWQ